jgi:hypothetical protein
MKTLVIIEVDHSQPITALANLIAGRAYTISGVSNAEVVSAPSMSTDVLKEAGFTLAEIRLGMQEVAR